MKRHVIVPFAIAFLSLLLSGAAFAANFYIDQTNGHNTSGTSGTQADPFKSIVYGMLTMNSRGTPNPWVVHIKAGTYDADPAKAGNEREVFPITLRTGITLQGDDGAANCIISGAFTPNSSNALVYGSGLNNITIKNLTLKDMSRTGDAMYGGGAELVNCSGTIEGCVLKNNRASYGGGFYVSVPSSKSFNVTNNTFAGNSAVTSFTYAYGGGFYAAGALTGSITNNTFSGNDVAAWYVYGSYGSGFYVGDALTGSISGNVFSGNSVNESGGGFYVSGALTGNIIDNTFSTNYTSYGEGREGGGFYVGGALTGAITNNTFSKNSARYSGGGIYLGSYGGTPESATISNNLFLYNSISGSSKLSGAACYTNQNAVIVNNTFVGSTVDESVLNISASASVIRNNIFSNVDTAIWEGGALNLAITYNDFNAVTDVLNRDNLPLGNDLVYLALLLSGFRNNSNWSAGLAGETVDTGTWSQAGVYDAVTNLTTLTDSSKSWMPGQWAGALVNASTEPSDRRHFYIVDNTATTLMVRGNLVVTGYVGADAEYSIDDYHLLATSQNIDAGSSATPLPTTDFEGDPRPSGAAPDIGADEYYVSPVPVIAPIADQSTVEGSPYTGPTPTLSQGELPVTWALVTGPSGMTIDAGTGVVSWPSATVTGSPHTVTISATNSYGSDEETWLLTVTVVPVIADIADHSTPDGSPYTGPTPTLTQGSLPVTWSLVTGPNGMTINSGTGVVSWPNPTMTGSPHTVTIRATNIAGTDDETWLLTVSPLAPIIAPIADHSTPDGSPYTGPTPTLTQGTLPVTWSLVTAPSGMAINSTTGIVSWPNPTLTGNPYTVTIRATNTAGSDDETWLLTVTAVVPQIASIADHSTPDASPYTGPTPTLTQGTLPVTWSLVTGPSGMTIDAGTGVISWPTPTVIGSPHTVTINVLNIAGADNETWLLAVTPVAPVIVPIADDSIPDGSAYTGPTPTLTQGTVPVTWSLVTKPSGMTINATTGVVSWPSPTVTGSPHTVTIRATNAGGSDDETWLLTVTPVAPVIAAISDGSISDGSPYTGPTPTLTQGTSPITWSLVTGPTGMTINSSTGVVSWTSTTVTGSPHTVTIRATNTAGTDDETWLLTVSPVAPVIASIADHSTSEGSDYTGPTPTLTQGTLPVTWSLVTGPSGMTINSSTGVVSWANPTVVGSPHTVTITVVNIAGADNETWLLTVTHVNRPPVLDPIGNKQVNEGELLQFTVTGSDPDGNGLTFSASNLPTGASFDPPTQRFSWTSAFGDAGNYLDVLFTVTDNGTPPMGDSESITITVGNVNQPPVLDPIGNKQVNEGELLQFTVTGSDPDGNGLTFSASNLPTGATFDPQTQTFSWTPASGDAGNYPDVLFTVTDDGSPPLSDSESITITVGNVNRLPLLDPIGNKQVNEGELLEVTVTGSDPDGNGLTFSASNLPTGASFDPVTQRFSWTPAFGDAGNYPDVIFTVTDDGTPPESDSESITITVHEQPPVEGEGEVPPSDGEGEDEVPLAEGEGEPAPPGQDYYVSATTGYDITGDGSQSAPWATIQHAIDSVTGIESNPSDIRVAEGTYDENLIMKDYINLWGGYDSTIWARDIAANETIIDGELLDSCVKFTNVLGGAVDGFTIRNGQATSGGGIYCDASSPTIRNNVISANSANEGGGIYCYNNSAAIIQNNIISANLATYGGGIDCTSSSPTIENNTISGNSASISGGGIGCDASSPTIQNNIISGNSAAYGGGIRCYTSSPTLENNTISANSASISGGGILCRENSFPTIQNTAFYGNTNYDIYEYDANSDPLAYYNEFYGSTAGIWYDEGATALTTIAQVNALAEAENNISVPPGFMPSLTGLNTGITYNPTTFQSTLTDSSAAFSPGALAGLLLNPDISQYLQFAIASNTATTIVVWGDITGVATAGDSYKVFDYHLASDSALIDAGTDLGAGHSDIDGDSRPSGAGFDMGADEYVSPTMTILLPGDVPLELVWIPAGTFLMGRTIAEVDSFANEDPRHPVTFARGFWMSRYETTQLQWAAVAGSNPSYFQGANAGNVNTDNRPVEQVSWNDVQSFLDALNPSSPSFHFRLPTEAEWEYACRAGTTTRFYWGDDATYTDIGAFAWYDGNSASQTHDAGGKLPNPWGLYDMSGNAGEWVQDWWHDSYSGAPADGSAWEAPAGQWRVHRGGDVLLSHYLCRSAQRGINGFPDGRYGTIGFRLVADDISGEGEGEGEELPAEGEGEDEALVEEESEGLPPGESEGEEPTPTPTVPPGEGEGEVIEPTPTVPPAEGEGEDVVLPSEGEWEPETGREGEGEAESGREGEGETAECPGHVDIHLSTDTLGLCGTITVSGTVSSPRGEAGRSVEVHFVNPAQATVTRQTTMLSNGRYTLDLSPDLAGEWKVQTYVPPDGNDPCAGSGEVSFTVDKAQPSLSVDSSYSVLVLGTVLDVFGRLSVASCSSLPSQTMIHLVQDQDVEVWAVDPDNHPIRLGTATTGIDGSYQFAGINQLNREGTWELQVRFTGSTDLLPVTESKDVEVVGTPGYAILIVGRLDDNAEGEPSHIATMEEVYRSLLAHGLSDEEIQLLVNRDKLPDDVDMQIDDIPTKQNISYAIQQWARDKMNTKAAPLMVVMVGHGRADKFYVSTPGVSGDNAILAPAELDVWLDNLQAALLGQARNMTIVVVNGSCYSGSFISKLSGTNRIIITSADPEEESYRGPERNGIRDGEYFITQLFREFSELEEDNSLAASFERATQLTEDYTWNMAGNGNRGAEQRYFDGAAQHPLLDDNADGQGTNGALSEVSGVDGALASKFTLALVGNPGGSLEFLSVSPSVSLTTEDNPPQIEARLENWEQADMAFIEVKPPDFALSQQSQSLQKDLDLLKIPSSEFDRETGTIRWTDFSAIGDFSTPGTYEIYYYVVDSATGELVLSTERGLKTIVRRGKEDNNPPGEFELTSPEDDARTNTILLLDWSDSVDPDGDAVSYDVQISTDINIGSEDDMVVSGLSHSYLFVDGSYALQWQTTYYWRVIAWDEFGAERRSEPFVFTTDREANPPIPSVIIGTVYDEATIEVIEGAGVSASSVIVVRAETGPDGAYALYLPDGEGSYSLTAKATGYYDQGPKVVRIGFGEVREVPFAMTTGEEGGAGPSAPLIPGLCPAASATASTALAAKLDWLREWRDGLLATRFGAELTAAYYWISRK